MASNMAFEDLTSEGKLDRLDVYTILRPGLIGRDGKEET